MVALGLSLLALRSAAARPAPVATDFTCLAPALPAPAPPATDIAQSLDTPPLSRPLGSSARSLARAARRSPEMEVGEALRLTNFQLRTAALASALAAWAATDAGAALVWLDQHPAEDTALLAQAIGEGLAADPAATPFALAYLAQDRELGSLLAGALVRTLAAQGKATAAVRLARAHPEGWAHEWATVAFANLAYEDAATALEALAAVGDPALRRTTAAAIIAGWAERDPAELARHAAVFSAPAEHRAARATALEKWRQRDPAAAALFAATLLPRG